jgi:hypothetical protein
MIMKVIVIIVLAVVLAPAAASAAVYGGAVTGGDPIAITVAKSGKLKRIGIAWTAHCGSGQQYTYGGILVPAAKKPSVLVPGSDVMLGGIKKNKLTASSVGALVFADGFSGEVTQRISGKLTPTFAVGSWRASIDVLDPEGRVVDVCKTGLLRWSARRGPTVYGGSTTQGEPVVVEVSPDRTRVSYFGFGWEGDCGDGSIGFSQALGNFALTEGGAFEDRWTNDYPFSDGSGKATYNYAFAATLRKGHGGGTISADYTETDTAGATTLSCRTGTVRWNVTQ